MNSEIDSAKNGCFKACPFCEAKWLNRKDFLNDSSIKLIGYQANFSEIESGLFYFNHLVGNCKTTLALEIRDFSSLYEGKKHQTLLRGSEQCEGYCLERDNLDNCHAGCKAGYARELAQLVKSWPKK